jgi:hypothetical protein
MRRGITFAVVLFLAMSAHAAEDPEARGDRLWARRAEGFAAAHKPDPAIAGGAVKAYEEALRARPGDLRLRFKLVEALYFAGHFTAAAPDEARDRFDRMVELADEACSLAGARPGEAVEAHFWAAVSWGLWGMSHGHLAAAMKDVAGRVRDHSAKVAALDPAYRDAAGWRILGRLHTVVPRIPMMTDWVDREQGIAFLRQAYGASARDLRNPLFLAEALLESKPEERGQALALLREVAAKAPRAEEVVEETETIEEARRVLAEAEAGR